MENMLVCLKINNFDKINSRSIANTMLSSCEVNIISGGVLETDKKIMKRYKLGLCQLFESWHNPGYIFWVKSG